jgi:multiple sugar transport system substrate-binding protein
MKRKSAALVLAVLMAVGSLAGCGDTASGDTTASESETAENEASAEDTEDAAAEKDSEESKEVKLTFAWWGNQVRNERTQQVLDMYTEENPGVTFDAQMAQWSDY